MRLPYELHLAFRYLLSVITMISAAGVVVGTAALVIALALMTGFQNDLRDRILRGSAHLTVMNAGGSVFQVDDTLLERIEKTSGVSRAGPVLYTPAMLTNEELGSPAYAQINGIEPDRHSQVILLGEGENFFEGLSQDTDSGRDGIVLGEGLAADLGAVKGDPVRVLVPRVTLTPFSALPRSKVFEVVGFFRTDSYLQDSKQAYIDLEAARRLLRAEGSASWIDVRVEDEGELASRKSALSAELGVPWLVLDMIEQNQDFLKALNTEKIILFMAIGLIVVVAALNIVSTLILMVADKIKEIGTLTAMGARPLGIAGVFMLQGLVIGTVGTLLGLTLGASVSSLLDHYRVIKLNPEVYYLTHVPFAPTTGDMVFVGTLALLISFVATLYPAWKAATLDPVEALRYE